MKSLTYKITIRISLILVIISAVAVLLSVLGFGALVAALCLVPLVIAAVVYVRFYAEQNISEKLTLASRALYSINTGTAAPEVEENMLHVRTGDEIEILADEIINTKKKTAELTNKYEESEEEHLRFLEENRLLRSDRIIAENIQKNMLPVGYPAFPEFGSLDLFADMDGAKEIGGDFYDYFKIDDNRICFGIADVEGKGIPAAMYMAVAKTMIKIQIMSEGKISEVFEAVSRQLCRGTQQKRFITSWMAELEVNTGRLTYVNAGHNYPLLKRRDEKAQPLRNRSGIPIASYYSPNRPDSVKYTEFETQLGKGDLIVLYTDGVTEAMNKNGELFGEERLRDAVDLYMEDDHSAKDLAAYIKRAVLRFADNVVQEDDITLLILKIV